MIIQVVKVSGNSLLPTYRDGDFVVVSRIPVMLGRLSPGDVITFETQDHGAMIKLIDTISEDGTEVMVKGTHPLSVDSRRFGPIRTKAVTGKVVWHVRKTGRCSRTGN